jgi:hypothetical protein
MEKGSLEADGQERPVARLLQEDWNIDGTIAGTVFERVGRDFRQINYRGMIRPLSDCRVLLERRPRSSAVADHLDAEAVLDATGIPHYSLSRSRGSTVTGIWRRQTTEGCRGTTLTGTVLSQQQGLSWQKGWRPNAVVQREQWKDGRVEGVALNSYAGALQTVNYTGTVEIGADCLARIVQRDSTGTDYNYWSVVMADGSGYYYLQTDPDDITVGWLERADP